MTTDLKDLLTRAADEVTERDFVSEAWDGARLVRRRLRWVGAAAAAAVAAAITAVAVLPNDVGGDRDTLPAATPTPSAPMPWKGEPFDVLGADAVFGPHEGQVDALPWVDAAVAQGIGLPRALTPDADEIHPFSVEQAGLLAAGKNDAAVEAVILRYTSGGTQQAVLYRPALESPWQELDTLELHTVSDASGNRSSPLSSGAISPDGVHVVFPRPDGISIADIETGSVKDVTVPDPFLTSAEWTRDGRQVIARSDTGTWRITVETGVVSSAEGPMSASSHSLSVSPDGESTLHAFDRAGELSTMLDAPNLFSGTNGTTASNAYLAAAGGYLGERAETTARGAFQAVLATDLATRQRSSALLVPSESLGLAKGCCRALRFVGRSTVLVTWGSDILLWDVETSDLERVSETPRTEGSATDTPHPGSFDRSFAVAPTP